MVGTGFGVRTVQPAEAQVQVRGHDAKQNVWRPCQQSSMLIWALRASKAAERQRSGEHSSLLPELLTGKYQRKESQTQHKQCSSQGAGPAHLKACSPACPREVAAISSSFSFPANGIQGRPERDPHHHTVQSKGLGERMPFFPRQTRRSH